MRAWARDTACCANTTWQVLSRPRVMTASSSTCSIGLAALPASLRCVTVSRTLIARASTRRKESQGSEGVFGEELLARLGLVGEFFRGAVLEEVLARDGRRVLLGLVLVEQEEPEVAGGVLAV